MSVRRRTRDDTGKGKVFRATAGNAPSSHAQVHPWRVLHVSDVTAPLAALVSGQLEVGMRPEVLTRHGSIRSSELSSTFFKRYSGAAPVSLIDLWRHSRAWQRLIRNTERIGGFELVHTHNLSSAFAAARRSTPSVYDIEHFPTHLFSRAENGREVESHWLSSRTFRSAEQFVLNRVVTVCHRNSVRNELLSRGASADYIFVIPEAFFVSAPPAPDYEWLKAKRIEPRRNIVLYAPAWKLTLDAEGYLTPASRTLLEVFTVIASESEDIRFVAEFAPQASPAIAEWSAALDIKSRLHLIHDDERHIAEISADIIIASDLAFSGPKSALNPFALRALLHRKALLASDVEPNRDLTPDGRGCLWYAHKSPRDLARRAAFLARNPDFRHALAASGHNYFRESREPINVAEKYDAVYRRAFSRNARGRSAPPLGQLAPVQMIV